MARLITDQGASETYCAVDVNPGRDDLSAQIISNRPVKPKPEPVQKGAASTKIGTAIPKSKFSGGTVSKQGIARKAPTKQV